MSDIEKAAKAWVEARSVLVQMPMDDKEWRKKLNDLSNAENDLVRAVRYDN